MSDGEGADGPGGQTGTAGTDETDSVPESEQSIEELRDAVEERYDFEEFTEHDMADMSQAEWAAVFDADSWITGAELLDRLERDLRRRVAERDLFAVVERLDDRVLAYSDSSWAVVHGSGRLDGEGPLRREIEPFVALCAMEDYEPEAAPVEKPLPNPEDVEVGSGRLGNLLLQLVALVQVLGGIGLLVAPLLVSLPGSSTVVLTTTAGLGFVAVGVVLFVLVANARLSGRFQAEGYRQRLEAARVGVDERPDFIPVQEESDSEQSG